MKNDKNQSNCEFAEQIVAYIYDEASAKEKENFEAHLLNCLTCADEIAGFGLVRSSINDWRKDEIFVLDAPMLEFPALRPSFAVSAEKGSWFDDFKKLFDFSPVWAAGFAALMICFGLAWLFLGKSNNEIASNKAVETNPIVQNKENETIITPIEEKTPIVTESKTEIQPQIVQPRAKLAKQTPITKQKEAKSVSKKVNSEIKVTVNNQLKRNQTKESPILADISDEEDNSLRLSSLADEIGAR